MTAAPSPNPALGGALALALAGALLSGCEETPRAEGTSKQAAAHEQTVESGPVELSVRAAPTELTVADRVRLSLTIEYDEATEIEWPDAAEALGEELALAAEEQSPPTITDEGRTRVRRAYVLEPDLPGETTIGAFEIAWRAGGGEGTVRTEPVPITIRSLLQEDDEAEVAPRKGVAEPPPPIERWLAIGAAALLALVVLTALIVMLIRRALRRRRDTPPLSPHEAALLALQRLEEQNLLGAGRQEEFVERLADILRRYVEGRFGLDAPHRTTEEFLRDARRSPVMPADDAGQIARFLRQCDLVKFARGHVTRAEAEEALAMARSFVERTRPVVEHPDGPVRPAAPHAEEVSAS